MGWALTSLPSLTYVTAPGQGPKLRFWGGRDHAVGSVPWAGDPTVGSVSWAGDPTVGSVSWAGDPTVGSVHWAGDPTVGSVHWAGDPTVGSVSWAGDPTVGSVHWAGDPTVGSVSWGGIHERFFLALSRLSKFEVDSKLRVDSNGIHRQFGQTPGFFLYSDSH